MLNDPPLIHAKKPDSKYANNLASYRALTDLLTRARLAGHISWNAIADETRTFTAWETSAEPAPFVKRELNDLLKGYELEGLKGTLVTTDDLAGVKHEKVQQVITDIVAGKLKGDDGTFSKHHYTL